MIDWDCSRTSMDMTHNGDLEILEKNYFQYLLFDKHFWFSVASYQPDKNYE